VTRNILYLGFLRGGNIFIQLLLIPVSIRYVSSEQFGLWLTISSMITWLNIMDFGLSNGLRNKLSLAMVGDDKSLGRIYVSTTYAILFSIAIVGIIVVGIGSYFINWNQVLSVPANLSPEILYKLIVIVICSFFITFLLKPISAIAYSYHKPFIDPLISFCAALVNLGAVMLLSYLDQSGNILYLGLIFCFTPILINFVLSVVLYKTVFKDYVPKISCIDLGEAKPLMSLSSKFFIIQIAATIVLTTTNFIISHYFGNEAVTEYNIVQRYFSVIIILQGMVLVPFWNLITEAYTKQQQEWLQKTMKRLFSVNVVFTILILLMIWIAPIVFKMWLGSLVKIPSFLVFIFGVYTIIFINASVLTTFINGTGKVKVQMISSVFTCLLYLPFVITLIRTFNIGVTGIVIVGLIWSLIMLPLRYVQYLKLIDFRSRQSIWNA